MMRNLSTEKENLSPQNSHELQFSFLLIIEVLDF